MIVNRKEMLQIEKDSAESESSLMEKAAIGIADELSHLLQKGDHLLVLAGSGNNGGDAYAVSRLLKDRFSVSVMNVCGLPEKKAALDNYRLLDKSMFISSDQFSKALEEADAVLDGVFGFSFHGSLSSEISDLFDAVNASSAKVYSIDINSGAECDSGYWDPHAIRSDITFALDCYKPFHMLRKEHQLFQEVRLISLSLPHTVKNSFMEMNEDVFFAHFPKKKENAYKGTYGKTMLIGGSYGMAGALSLNILGARTVGAPYIEAGVTHDIYPIEAFRHTTTVFHPFGHDDYLNVLKPAVSKAAACSFGSGCVNMDRKQDILDLVLQESQGPCVLDAEALNLLHQNTWVLRFANCPVILTPHVGEFSKLIHKSVDDISRHRVQYAGQFASKNHVYVVLKGSNTVVAAPDGRFYINQSGNAALAQAGSGDLLTGMMAGMLTIVKEDVFTAVCMAVWLHGWIAEKGMQYHSIQNFPLEDYPAVIDKIFQKHQY